MSKYLPSYKQAALSIAVLTIIFTAGLTDGYECFASSGQKEAVESKREQIMASIEEADYDAWRQNVGTKNSLTRIISPTDFQEFVRLRQEARSGYYDKSVMLAQNLKIKLNSKLSRNT